MRNSLESSMCLQKYNSTELQYLSYMKIRIFITFFSRRFFRSFYSSRLKKSSFTLKQDRKQLTNFEKKINISWHGAMSSGDLIQIDFITNVPHKRHWVVDMLFITCCVLQLTLSIASLSGIDFALIFFLLTNSHSYVKERSIEWPHIDSLLCGVYLKRT